MKKQTMKHIKAHFTLNTHLDREWTMDFHYTKKLKVELIDNLIKITRKIESTILSYENSNLPEKPLNL